MADIVDGKREGEPNAGTGHFGNKSDQKRGTDKGPNHTGNPELDKYGGSIDQKIAQRKAADLVKTKDWATDAANELTYNGSIDFEKYSQTHTPAQTVKAFIDYAQYFGSGTRDKSATPEDKWGAGLLEAAAAIVGPHLTYLGPAYSIEGSFEYQLEFPDSTVISFDAPTYEDAIKKAIGFLNNDKVYEGFDQSSPYDVEPSFLNSDFFRFDTRTKSALETFRGQIDDWLGIERPKPQGGGGIRGPVVLSLNDDSINIVERFSSNTFFDTEGDGYQHRTAWAGAGDGVLVIDADGDGKITERREIIFTD